MTGERPTSPRAARLARAMQLWLATANENSADRERLLQDRPELREFLEPLSTPQAQVPCERVLGDFRLEREIGRGGMGVVYEARQISLDRRVALKVLRPDLVGQPTSIARFRREALTLARLEHPGIVRVLAVGSDAQAQWFAMELIDGGSLADLTSAQRQPTAAFAAWAANVVAQVADALAHVHAAGILHRDVKPANIVLRGDGRAVLTDFGVAHEDDDVPLTATGACPGTCDYLAPEQVDPSFGQLDPRSEIFSLGVTSYELLTGVRPFSGQTRHETLTRLCSLDPAPPHRLRDGIPHDLSAIVMKCLEKTQTRRYQTATALASDLRRHLHGETVTARPARWGTRLRRWTSRRRSAPLFMASLAVATITALSIYVAVVGDEIRVGQQVLASEQLEACLGQAYVATLDGKPAAAEASIAHARRLAPTNVEVFACALFAAPDGRRTEDTWRALDPQARFDPANCPPALRRMRAVLLRREGRQADADAVERSLQAPSQPFDLLVLALRCLDPRTPRTRDSATSACELLARAVRLSVFPRLDVYMVWSVAIDAAGDVQAAHELATDMPQIWPDRTETAAALERVAHRQGGLSERAATITPEPAESAGRRPRTQPPQRG